MSEEQKFAPKCIWCNAEWSEENVRLETYISGGCPTCGQDAEAKVTITCHECKRVMYEKETYGW